MLKKFDAAFNTALDGAKQAFREAQRPADKISAALAVSKITTDYLTNLKRLGYKVDTGFETEESGKPSIAMFRRILIYLEEHKRPLTSLNICDYNEINWTNPAERNTSPSTIRANRLQERIKVTSSEIKPTCTSEGEEDEQNQR